MRIRRLDLIAFGPFSGESLDLGAVRGAVDVIYGPNEAGKSTTLRAIFGLLFGIPDKTFDAHRHAPSELRVGAVLLSERGDAFHVVRRKGRKATLLAPDGKALPDDALGPVLGGTDEELFRALFGLDHLALRASGKALLDGKGSVGESLFSAGMAARSIHLVRERFREEADSLFTTRGREQKAVVKAIQEVREAKRLLDDVSVSPRAADAQREALEQATLEGETLRERLAALRAEQATVERLLEISPHLAQREHVLTQLSLLGDTVLLPSDAAERRRSAVRVLEEARQKRRRVAEDLERVDERLGALVVPEELLSLEEAVVRDVEARRNRHVSAEIDLPKLGGKLAGHEEAVKKTLVALDPSLTLASIDRLRIGAARSARIRKLAEERRALSAESGRLSRELGAVLTRRELLSARLVASLGPQPSFDRTVLATPSALSVPPPEVSERHEGERARLDAERALQARDQSRVEARLRDVLRDTDALRRAGDVPTEETLGEARRARDGAFAGFRARVLAKETLEERALDAYEHAVSTADELSDRLRREADRAAKLAALEAERAALEADLRGLADRVREIGGREGAVARAFDARWAALGITPLPPEEMRAWSERFLQLLELEGERTRLERETDGQGRELEKWQVEWTDSMALLGLPPRSTPDESIALLDATSDLLRRVEATDDVRRRIDGIRRDSLGFTEEVTELCRSRFPAAADLPPAEAAALLVHAYEKAKNDDTERHRLGKERLRLEDALRGLEAVEREAAERVASLVAAGRAADLDALEAAERRSEAALSLGAERERVERRLTELGEGASIEELVARARAFDGNRARARLPELQADIERLSEELLEVAGRIATLEAGTARFEQAAAADAAAEAAERVSTLKRLVHRYVRVRLASVVLDREIERYRQANQGPIVERANALFPRLTAGRYAGLRVGFGANDEAVLRAVRTDGSDVGVDALSDGTRDALYLALRLATLERHARSNEPMPLVLDDVLIQLDDERAKATLVVLGEIAQTTEVLFFTHHARLVELAREALGEAGLVLHRLARA